MYKRGKLLIKSGTELRYPNRLSRNVKTILTELVCPQLVKVKVKVKQSRYRPGVAQRVPES